MKLSICSSNDGLYGKFCKHQCAVYKSFGVVGTNFPPVTSKDLHSVAYLALGDKTPALAFYEPFIKKEGISLQNASENVPVSENSSVSEVISCCPSERIENVQDNMSVQDNIDNDILSKTILIMIRLSKIIFITCLFKTILIVICLSTTILIIICLLMTMLIYVTF